MTAALRQDAAPWRLPPAPLVSVEGLTVRFRGGDGEINAVNGVDFTLERGKVLTILGSPAPARASR